MRPNFSGFAKPYIVVIGVLWLVWEVLKSEIISLLGQRIPEGGIIPFFFAHPTYVMPTILLVVAGVGWIQKSKRRTRHELSAAAGTASPVEDGRVEPLRLVESFPEDNQEIAPEDVKRMYLKFSKPVDRESVKYIGNFHVRTNTFCQWDVCGWIQYAEDDTKLIWHVKEPALQNEDNFGAIDIDYHTFEIHLGRPPEVCRVEAVDGSTLPRTIIRVKMRRDA